MQRIDERREFQRLTLDPPIPGTVAGQPVSIHEIGVLGARVLHAQPLEESSVDSDIELTFAYDDRDVTLRCRIARTNTASESSQYESGLRFLAAVGDSGDLLRAMLAALVTQALEQRREQTKMGSQQPPIDGDKTVRGGDAGYLSYRLENGIWQRRHVFLPEQPAVGFTVARSVDADEMQRLCRVYQASDDEGRRLIRLFAELSVSQALEIPPRA